MKVAMKLELDDHQKAALGSLDTALTAATQCGLLDLMASYNEPNEINRFCGCVNQMIADAAQPAEWDADGDHPLFGSTDWKQEVANGDTKLGYVEWVNHQLETTLL